MTTKAELEAIRNRDAASNPEHAVEDRHTLLKLFDQALEAAKSWKAKYEDTLCEECFGSGKFPTGYEDRTVKCKRCDGTGKEP